VYTGEHYVIDVLLGWLYAAAIYGVGSWAYRRWRERHPARDVEDGVEHQVERAAAPSAAAAV
jgi:membrane-associated phospholipid phosphatase